MASSMIPDDDEPDLKLRPYQARLVDLASKDNTIVWLGTGMGKTYVAVELIKQHLELAKTPISEGGKRIVFLVPTVPLARQQDRVIQRFANVSTQRCCGVDGVDLWDGEKWRRVVEDNGVLVMTPQVLRDCLQKSHIDMKLLSLIIFDECHHSVGDSMYTQIMKYYEPASSEPRILAMTATLINSKIKMPAMDANFKYIMNARIQDHLDNLCSTLNCRVHTTNDPKEYNNLGANPHIECRRFEEFGFEELIAEIKSAEIDVESLLECDRKSVVFQQLKKVLLCCEGAICDLGPVGTRSILNDFIRQQEARLTGSNSVADIAQVRASVDICKKLENLIAKHQKETDCEMSAKVQLLIETLWEFSCCFSKNEEIKDDDQTDDNSMCEHDEYFDYWLKIMSEEYGLDFANENSRVDDSLLGDDLPELADDEFDVDGVEAKRRRLKTLRDETVSKITAKVMELNAPSSPGVCPTPVASDVSLLQLESQELERVSNHSGLCCVVFVERRLTCAALANVLQKASKDPDSSLYKLISVDYVVGQSSSSGGQYRSQAEAVQALSSTSSKMSEKRQDAILGQFRVGLLNVIVATNVLEEGLDVPQCNLIVMFDMPKTPKDFIQSKGRGRAKGSHYVLLVPESKFEDMTREVAYFRLTEKIMMQNYFGFMDQLDMNATISSQLRDELVPPFCPLGADGARIDRLRAVDMINQYVVRLGKRSVDVGWEERKEGSRYFFKATVYLPQSSGVDAPISHMAWMPTKKLANQAAALECCKILYTKGEIRLDGIPTQEEASQSVVNKESIIPDEPQQSSMQNGMKKKRKVQIADRQLPAFLAGSTISSKERLYLYDMKLDFENVLTDDTKQLLEMVVKSGSSFGFLSPRPLESVPKFRLYPRKHEVIAKLELVETLQISAKEFEELTKFHQFLFEKIIFRVLEPCELAIEFSTQSTLLPFLVVPMKNKIKIDWDSVRNIVTSSDGTFSTELLPNNLAPDQTVVPTDDLIRVTSANSKSLVALVEVSQTLTAESPRPYGDTSYAKFLTKRGVEIRDPKQSLVYGVPLTSHLSMFSRQKLTGKSTSCNVGSYFVPETLRRLPISGSLSVLSRYVPSLLYRFYQLWLVKEFRLAISSSLDLPIGSNCDEDETIGDSGAQSDLFGSTNDFTTTEQDVATLRKAVNDLSLQLDGDAFDRLDEPLISLTADDLTTAILAMLSCPTLNEYNCLPCKYQVNVHLPHLFRTYFLVKGRANQQPSLVVAGSNRAPPLRLSYKCRVCRETNVDGKATCFDLLEHVVKTHFRLLTSPYVVWPSFHDVCCQVCRLVSQLTDSSTAAQNSEAATRSLANHARCAECERGTICRHATLNVAQPPSEICRRDVDDAVDAPRFSSFFQTLLSIRARDIYDNERFELLGDTFLKYAVTTYLFVKYPKFSQGRMTFIKGKLVSNSNLRNHIAKWSHLDLVKYLFLTPFDPSLVWLPPLYHDFSENRVRAGQNVADKVVADSVEALLGLFLTTCGPSTALKFLHGFGIVFSEMPEEHDPADLGRARHSDFSGWIDRLNSTIITTQSSLSTDLEARWIEWGMDDVEQKLGYHFKNRRLLLEAFCHPSAAGSLMEPYERLEVLGDALIDYLVTACLFSKSSTFKPGLLTTIRMAIVNNDILGSLCVLNGFDKFIKAAPSVISSIGAFVNDFFNDPLIVNGENRISSCPYRDCGTWADSVEVPKVLGDVLESLAGAVFVDSGLDLKVFWAVFHPLFNKTIDRFVEKKPCHPVRELYERLAQEGIKFRFDKPPRDFFLPPLPNGSTGVVLSVYINDMEKPAGTGRGLNTKLAKQAAANKTIANLDPELRQVRWRQ